jgi:hypothetical protein
LDVFSVLNVDDDVIITRLFSLLAFVRNLYRIMI